MQAERMLKLEKLKAENDAMREKLDAHREHFDLITFDFLPTPFRSPVSNYD